MILKSNRGARLCPARHDEQELGRLLQARVS